MKIKSIAFIILIAIIAIVFTFSLSKTDPKIYAQELLEQADIKINGNRPWDIQVHNENLYARAISEGSLGLGEAYIDGWWDAQNLDQFFYKVTSANIHNKIRLDWTTTLNYIKSKLINMQSKNRAFQIAHQHYDLDNDLFSKMLDRKMIYSCGYWCKANSLDQAQEHKLDLICKKIQLKPGMTLLDIGCGWGGLAQYAAQHYGVKVTGITVSKEQAKYAQSQCKGLPITIVVQDYRDINEQFDRIVSVGMFEHVGYKNYEEFFKVVRKTLKDDGLFLLHTIGSNTSNTTGDSWILKYIFPNSMLPSISQISKSIEGLFIIEDLHNFGADYDKTLMAWHKNFNEQIPNLKQKDDQRFIRMWNYYLLSCAGMFRSRSIQLWQIVLSKYGIPGGYISIR